MIDTKLQERVPHKSAYSFIGLISGLTENNKEFNNVYQKYFRNLESLNQRQLISGRVVVNQTDIRFHIGIEKEGRKGINEVLIQIEDSEELDSECLLNLALYKIRDLVQKACIMAKNGELISYYMYETIHTKVLRLKESYILDGCRFDPIPFDERKPPDYINSPLPILSEQFNFSCVLRAPSINAAQNIGKLMTDNMASVLSVIFNKYIISSHGSGGSQGTTPPKWIYQLYNESTKQISKCLPEDDKYGITEMKMPSYFPVLWSKLTNANEEIRDYIFESCKLFQLAIKNYDNYPRIAMVLLVSSIEILAQLRCPGNTELQEKFVTTILKYGDLKGDDAKKFLQRVYNYRSKHLHQYGLHEPESSIVFNPILYPLEYLEFDKDYLRFEPVVSKVIVNYILRY